MNSIEVTPRESATKYTIQFEHKSGLTWTAESDYDSIKDLWTSVKSAGYGSVSSNFPKPGFLGFGRPSAVEEMAGLEKVKFVRALALDLL